MKLATRKQIILSIFCHFFLKGKKNMYKQLQNLIQSGLHTKSICKFSNWKTGVGRAPGTMPLVVQ